MNTACQFAMLSSINQWEQFTVANSPLLFIIQLTTIFVPQFRHTFFLLFLFVSAYYVPLSKLLKTP